MNLTARRTPPQAPAYRLPMAVTREDVERWWEGLSEEDRVHLATVGDLVTMSPKTERIIETLPGLPRMKGSFQGLRLPEPMPEPVRSFVREHRIWKHGAPRGE
jgi:hypothetical protein